MCECVREREKKREREVDGSGGFVVFHCLSVLIETLVILLG